MYIDPKHLNKTFEQNNKILFDPNLGCISFIFLQKSSLSETHNYLTSKTMEENYSDVKSDFEYTIELNEELDPDLRTNINPNLGKILSNNNGSIEINGVLPKPSQDERESSSGVESDDIDSSDYVYVLEPDESIDLQLDGEDEPESRSSVNDSKYGIVDYGLKREVSEEVMDLSGSSKRKRKSNLASTLSHIHKIKSVCVNQENTDILEENNEHQANKVHIIEKNEIAVHQNPSLKNVLSNVINDESPKDLSIKSENKSELCSPMYSTPVLSKVVNGGSSRKNRRKRSIPVRCEKNEEMCDITDIVEEYGIQPEFKAKTAIQEYAEKGVEFAAKGVEYSPIDLAPKSYASTASMERKIERNLFAAPLDLTPSATAKVVEETIMKPPPIKLESVQPVDLSKPTNQMLNGIKNEVVNGGPQPPMLPCAMPFDPVQMRQLFEHVYKMQAQFPNQNIVQTQLMQFHALMQNAMLNGGVMSGNNLNGKKGSSSVNSDQNDNVVKNEPGAPNNPIANEYQNFNIDAIYKNGLLQNNFAPPFNAFTPCSLQSSSPFTPSPTSQMKNRSVRKKNKEQSLMMESSPDSPKTEGSLPLISLDAKYGSEQILNTLQKHFSIVPIENLPKAQISEDIIGNPVKFFVKDNEQIRVIVDSLLLVGVLDLHEQQNHGTEPVYKYICRVCSQTFFHVEHLTKHIKKHHVIKKYQCSECDR